MTTHSKPNPSGYRELCDSGDVLPELRQGELSKKQETHSPRNKYLGQPIPPVTPSCCLSAHGFLATSLLHCSLCSHSCLLGFASTFLGAHSPLSHTRPLSAVAAPLFTLRALRSTLAKHNGAEPETTEFQTQTGSSGTGNGLQIKETAQKKAAPCAGLLLQILTTQRKRTQDLPIVGQGSLLLRQLWLGALGIKASAGERWGKF